MKYTFYSINQIDNDEIVYIGSTIDYKRRMRHHKSRCKNENDKEYNKPLYIYIREQGGFNNFIFDIIDEVECDNKNEALAIENKYINEYKPKSNVAKPGALLEAGSRKEYDKLYREANKDKMKEYMKQYREANKQKKSEYDKQYRARKKAEKIQNIYNIQHVENLTINN